MTQIFLWVFCFAMEAFESFVWKKKPMRQVIFDALSLHALR